MEKWDLYNLDRKVVGEHIRGNAAIREVYEEVAT
jgi:hypothetical protein